jgi:hypothetical protein
LADLNTEVSELKADTLAKGILIAQLEEALENCDSSEYILKLEVVELFDMNGRRVYSAPANNSEIKIDMSNFQSGNYILRIGNRVARIVIQ